MKIQITMGKGTVKGRDMGMGFRFRTMGSIMDTGRMISIMEKANWNINQVMFMKGNGWMICIMDMESS